MPAQIVKERERAQILIKVFVCDLIVRHAVNHLVLLILTQLDKVLAKVAAGVAIQGSYTDAVDLARGEYRLVTVAGDLLGRYPNDRKWCYDVHSSGNLR